MNGQITRDEITMTNNLSDIKRHKLAQTIEKMHENLLTSVRVLVWKMGMVASRQEADDLAHEILNETVSTALVPETVNRYELDKSAHAWLIGIATNKIKEIRTKENRRSKRMGVATDAFQSLPQMSNSVSGGHDEAEQVTEDEMIDYLVAQSSNNNSINFKIHLNFDELVSLVGPDDRLVLKLAFVDNLKGKDLAATLKTSEGSTNVRLSRAIRRIRQAYLASESSERSE